MNEIETIYVENYGSDALIVKYHNSLNSIVAQFSEIELNVFFAICARIKNNVDVVDFSFPDLKVISHCYISKTNFAKHLQSIQMKTAHLFATFDFSVETEILSVKIAPQSVSLFNDVKCEFARFLLKDFVQIKGVYSKRLYCLLMQFRKTGIYRISVNNFYKAMGIPATYKMCDVTSQILSRVVNELSNVMGNIKISKIKQRSNKILAFEFRFKAEKGVAKNETKSFSQRKFAQTNAELDKAFNGKINKAEQQKATIEKPKTMWKMVEDIEMENDIFADGFGFSDDEDIF